MGTDSPGCQHGLPQRMHFRKLGFGGPRLAATAGVERKCGWRCEYGSQERREIHNVVWSGVGANEPVIMGAMYCACTRSGASLYRAIRQPVRDPGMHLNHAKGLPASGQQGRYLLVSD